MTLSIQMAHAVETTISNKEWFIPYAGRENTMADGKSIKEAEGLKKAFCFTLVWSKMIPSLPEQTMLNYWFAMIDMKNLI